VSAFVFALFFAAVVILGYIPGLNAKHVLRATAARTGEQAFADAADQLVAH